MTVITLLENHACADTLPDGAVFVLGHFDGVHLGHRALLDEAQRMARDTEGGLSRPIVVWTLTGLMRDGSITTEEEKRSLLRRYGAAYTVTDAFEEIKDLPGEVFFRERIAHYHPMGVVCGYNFTFGKGASCRAEELCRMADNAGIRCAVVPAYSIEGEPVSSTRIRHLLLSGDMEGAARRLGHPYSVSGEVLHGYALGRTIGYPTVNLRLTEGKLMPPRGVYASVTRLERDGVPMLMGGMTNLGSRPTVNWEREDVTLETNLFGEPGDLYGTQISVSLLRYIRPEKKFASVEALRESLARDRAAVSEVLEREWGRINDETCI